MTGCPSLWWLHSILLFFVPLSINGHTESISWLLWIVLQSTWVCGYLFDTPIASPLETHPIVGQLDHLVDLFSVFWGTSTLFFTMATLVYIPSYPGLTTSKAVWKQSFPSSLGFPGCPSLKSRSSDSPGACVRAAFSPGSQKSSILTWFVVHPKGACMRPISHNPERWWQSSPCPLINENRASWTQSRWL